MNETENQTNLTEIPTRIHALLGGSSAHRWTNCPGSCFFIKDLPPSAPSEHALLGTRQHEVCETVLKHFLQYKIEGTDPDIAASLLFNDEELGVATFYRDSVWHEVLEQSITGKAFGFEDKFTINDELDMSGYVDFWCIHIDERAKRVLSIVDFKNGMHEVSADKNAQLAFYAVAARQEFQNHGKDIDKVKCYIIQPKSKTPVKSVEFTPKELDSWKHKFYAAADQIFVKKKPKFKTGDWCYFCPAKSICPTYAKELSAKTALKLVDPTPETLPVPEKVSDEVLVKLILNYDNVKNFLDSCYSYGMARHTEGKPLAGLKVVEGATRRRWLEGREKAIINALKPYGIEATDIKIKGIGVIEKALKLAIGKEETQKFMDTFTERTQPSLTLVPESDERLAVKSNIDLLD